MRQQRRFAVKVKLMEQPAQASSAAIKASSNFPVLRLERKDGVEDLLLVLHLQSVGRETFAARQSLGEPRLM